MRMALLTGATLAALALPSTAATAATNSFSNPGAIAITDNSPATPYPSNVAVAGQCGTVTDANVTLRNLSHSYPDDIDVLLVSPAGKKTLLMSDAGGGTDLVGATLSFDDAAAALLPNDAAITSGTYKPTDNDALTDVFSAPAPAGPYLASLAELNGTAPNGTWQLFVRDDNLTDGGSGGSIAGGWTLTLATADCPPPPPPATPSPSLPPPLAGVSVNAEPVGGTILVDRGDGFRPLSAAEQIPIGSTINARHGQVRITASFEGSTTSSIFFGGLFRVLQEPAPDAFTEIRLTGKLSGCGKHGKSRSASAGPPAHAAGLKGRYVWGKGGKGFRTHGKGGTASVRGTEWLVQDRCDGSTLTRVVEGVVSFKDRFNHKTVSIKAGKRYVARP